MLATMRASAVTRAAPTTPRITTQAMTGSNQNRTTARATKSATKVSLRRRWFWVHTGASVVVPNGKYSRPRASPPKDDGATAGQCSECPRMRAWQSVPVSVAPDGSPVELYALLPELGEGHRVAEVVP